MANRSFEFPTFRDVTHWIEVYDSTFSAYAFGRRVCLRYLSTSMPNVSPMF